MKRMVTTIIGFLPMRSAKMPQGIEVKALPSIYEAPKKVKNPTSIQFLIITIIEKKHNYSKGPHLQNQHRIQYLLLFWQCSNLVSVVEKDITHLSYMSLQKNNYDKNHTQ